MYQWLLTTWQLMYVYFQLGVWQVRMDNNQTWNKMTMKLSNPNTVTRTKSRETVHNSSWRPPGMTKRSQTFQVARSRPQRSKLLRRSLTSYILWQLLACLPNIVICESLEEGLYVPSVSSCHNMMYLMCEGVLKQY